MNPRNKLYIVLACLALGYCLGYIVGGILDELEILYKHVGTHSMVLSKITHDLYIPKRDGEKPLIDDLCEDCE